MRPTAQQWDACGPNRRGSLDTTERWAQARLGDQDARAELIESYRPYVSRLVARMGIPPTSVQEREDLVSAGVIGLIDAVDRFDHGRGVPFEAFARVRIQGAVIDELRRLDGRSRHFWRRVREGTTDEESMPPAVSLDLLIEAGTEPAGNDMTTSLLEQDLWNDVGIALMTLPRRERGVLQRYYGASRTLREIGSEMGVSEARVCQLHARAIAQLRRMLTMRDATFAVGVA
jgi:RNA polymerase sigma factor for flagellar operon FliA